MLEAQPVHDPDSRVNNTPVGSKLFDTADMEEMSFEYSASETDMKVDESAAELSKFFLTEMEQSAASKGSRSSLYEQDSGWLYQREAEFERQMQQLR